jgi:phosphohistidine phosphatase
MDIFFIRHAKAVDRESFTKDDLKRPLSYEGIEKAKNFFKHISKIYRFDVIITSKALRAIDTAKLLLNFFPNAKYVETHLLNPGASILNIELVIENFKSYDSIALVGHEPDFTFAISHLIGCSEYANIKLKKGAVAHLLYEDDEFELISLIQPKLFKEI